MINLIKLIKKYIKLYINYSHKKKVRNNLKKNGEEAIRSFIDVMSDLNIPFSPFFGTLLGIYRENGFIKHDDDIDFTMDAKYLSMELIEKLALSGFNPHHLSMSSDNEGCMLSMKYKGVLVEIYFYYIRDGKQCIFGLYPQLTNDEWYFYMQFGKYPVVERITPIIDSFVNHDFLNSSIQIPSNTKSILQSLYGEDFMIPIKGKVSSTKLTQIPLNKKYWHSLPMSLVDEKLLIALR